MNTDWYIAKLVFRITGNEVGTLQFDEQWRLIHAPSEMDAFEKAQAIGVHETECIQRPDGKTIAWEFVSVTDVFPFNANTDGVEVFSRIEEPANEGFYLQSVKAKSARYSEAKLES